MTWLTGTLSIFSICIILFLGYSQDSYHPHGNDIFDYKKVEATSNINNNTESFTSVIIPRGVANPEVDITNLEPRQWYKPTQVTVTEGEVVNWTNLDTAAHTVTSGQGAGIESLVTNKQGKATGIFDSGLIESAESWSYNFTKSGRYSYFCTIHPWMEGMVIANEKRAVIEVPSYPVDSSGSKLDRFPVHTLTNDQKYDIDLSWDPVGIVTGKPVSFIIDFFDPHTNARLHLLPYDFIISRNGTEIDRTSDGLSEAGTDIQEATFSEPGPITVRIENVGDTPSYTQFNTLVYDNPQESKESIQEVGIISDESSSFYRLISPLTLVYITYAIIGGIPAAVAVIVILLRKGII